MKKTRKSLCLIFLVIFFVILSGIFNFSYFPIIGKFFDENRVTTFISSNIEWNLTLVNKEQKIPLNWKNELTELSNGEFVDTRVYPYLQEMFDAARAEGIYPVVTEGYRTEKEQNDILQLREEKYVEQGFPDKKAKEKAEKEVAIPGTSEHQLGLALDINADTNYSTNQEVYEWLSNNAYKYGFILRYPLDKQNVTGIIYEPWHYRYVGVQVAKAIRDSGECLEEYLD